MAESHTGQRRTEPDGKFITLTDLDQAAAADSTIETYRRHCRDFDRWRHQTGSPWLEASLAERDKTLAAYLIHCHNELNQSPGYIIQHLTSVVWRERVNDRPRPVGKLTDRAKAAVRRRGRDRGRGQVRGLTWSQVERIATLCEEENSISGIRDSALFRVGSDCLLRIGEIRSADRGHVTFSASGNDGVLRIPHSKTDPYGAGRDLYLGPPTVAALRRWFEWGAHESPEDPLFHRVSRHNCLVWGRLSIQGIRHLLQRRAAQVGITEGVSGHSLRVGSAVSLARRGASMVEMMRVGRWRSEAVVARYVAGETVQRDAVSLLKYSGR